MANGEAVAKGCGNVFARLFDHRSALQGESRYFVKEFEKKRGDRDFDQIKQSVEMVKDTQHCLLPDGVKMAKDFLTPMQEKVDEVLAMMTDVLKIESEAETARQRKDRSESERDMEAFLEESAGKRKEIDDWCEQEVQTYVSEIMSKDSV